MGDTYTTYTMCYFTNATSTLPIARTLTTWFVAHPHVTTYT